ncbi:MAG: CNNM domain-containing protein [Acidobacteriota bacterium]
MEGVPLQLLLVAGALMLVFLNGFFVSAEFSIVKIRSTRLEELTRKGSKRAPNAQQLVENMDEYLSATQLGITLASLGLGWLGGSLSFTLSLGSWPRNHSPFRRPSLSFLRLPAR